MEEFKIERLKEKKQIDERKQPLDMTLNFSIFNRT